MTIYALVDPKNNIIRRMDNIDPKVETKPGYRWLPVVVMGDVAYDSETQWKDGPAVTVEASRVVEAFSIRNLTADELDARRTSRVEGLGALKLLFHLHNRVRALEGQPAHTLAQFKTAMKAVL